jgi:hypothetical protein
MGKLAQQAIKDVIDAYVEHDAQKAIAVWKRDDDLDDLTSSLFRELLTYMMEDPRSISPCAHLLFIAKNIERIGDHATNIAEPLSPPVPAACGLATIPVPGTPRAIPFRRPELRSLAAAAAPIIANPYGPFRLLLSPINSGEEVVACDVRGHGGGWRSAGRRREEPRSRRRAQS